MAVSRIVDSAGAPWQEDTFLALPGQVTFILGSGPTELNSLSVHVNGVEYARTDDYTVSGMTLTWLNTEFSMAAGDRVVVQYR